MLFVTSAQEEEEEEDILVIAHRKGLPYLFILLKIQQRRSFA